MILLCTAAHFPSTCTASLLPTQSPKYASIASSPPCSARASAAVSKPSRSSTKQVTACASSLISTHSRLSASPTTPSRSHSASTFFAGNRSAQYFVTCSKRSHAAVSSRPSRASSTVALASATSLRNICCRDTIACGSSTARPFSVFTSCGVNCRVCAAVARVLISMRSIVAFTTPA